MPTCTRAPRRARSCDDFAGDRLDYFVTGFGTGGTLKGVARTLKQARPKTQDHRRRARQFTGAGQPHSAAAQRRRQSLRQPSAFSSAPDAGLVAGFHFDADRRSGGRRVHRRDRAGGRRRCAALSRELARQEGIFVGTSSGATLAAALHRGATRAGRLEHRLHAARHRRALHVDAAVRRHRRGNDGRGMGRVAFDAAVPLRCAGARGARAGGAGAEGRSRSRRRALRRRGRRRTSRW